MDGLVRNLQRVAGSFRDPSGGVFESGGQIFRGVTAIGGQDSFGGGET